MSAEQAARPGDLVADRAGNSVGADAPVVGFLGPAGTFSEVAAGRLAGGWAGALVPVESIINVIQGVAEGSLVQPAADGLHPLPNATGGPTAPLPGGERIDAAVVPIENSTEGSVGATLDTLVDHPELIITAELDLPIEQLLVARSALPLDQIQQVYSHPQGIAQARRFLAEHVPQAGVVPVSSTSRSVELISEADEPWAAIGSRRAAELYGAVILRDDIQELVNVTRFVLIERKGHPLDRPEMTESAAADAPRRRAGDERPMKTSLFFEGDGDGSPGWLVRCLSEFAFRGVNLSKIESRPLRGKLGHYRFFLDLQGAADTPETLGAIEGLGHHADYVRILGSYPVAAEPS